MDCAIRAMARMLGITKDQIIIDLGHDGSEIVYPHLNFNSKYKGVHWQEYIDVCYKYGKTLTYILADPYIGRKGEEPNRVYEDSESRFIGYVKDAEGLLHLPSHCCYFKDNVVYDLGNKTYDLLDNDLRIIGAWLVSDIKS